ncbi:Sad1 / UNC-like C-terminal [Novymonas esmeraldas]|uniref:Sad1 / UNC-like C-terminal n=1 Tax=Novymonas esmeraldas TaxID=1808958 RepID=A0AAW0F4R4_9TRYP
MRLEERLTVLCALLLLYVVFSAPAELLSLPSRASTATGASSTTQHPAPRTGAVPGLSTNYASLYLGATVVSMEPPSCHGGPALISDSADKYVLCPCDAPRKQFVVQLIRDVEVRSVMLRNAEHFSSGVRNFTLLGSRQYPSATWVVLGRFVAEPRRGRQYFDIAPRGRVRFVRLQWATSHGAEPWCTITSFQVYGIDVLETLTRFEEDGEDIGAAAVDVDGGGDGGARGGAVAPLPSLPATLEELVATPPPTTTATATATTTTSITTSGGGGGDGVVSPITSLEDFAAGVWEGTGEAARDVDADATLAPVGEGELKRPSSTAAPPLVWAAAPAPPWRSCAVVQPEHWNASLQCTAAEAALLWFPCEQAVCSVSDVAAASVPGATAAAVAAAAAAAAAVAVGGAGGRGPAASRSVYQGAAASLLTQLLRQQRSTQQELALLTQRERHLALELNHTRVLLGDFYRTYKETMKESSEHRDRLRGLSAELQTLHERLLLRERSGGGGGGGGDRGGLMRNNTAMSVAAFSLSALAVVLVLVSSSSSAQRVVGTPSAWGRHYSINSPGGSGSPPGLRQQRGRPR